MATRKFAVLGSPIEHSKSPLIHSTAYGVLGLDWQYEKFGVRRGGLRRFLDEANEFSGFSVTMPLKEEAARIAVELDESASLTGAVNTLVRSETGWSGFNTDVFGIVQALRSANIVNLESVLLIGSGATATSAVVALRELAPKASVEIFARNAEARGNLVQFAKSLGMDCRSVSKLRSAAVISDLVVSTLPGGALDEQARKLGAWRGFAPRGAILDVAYAPWPSKIASYWLAEHRPTISGLDMLMWQAIAQLRIFTAGDASVPLANEVAVTQAVQHALRLGTPEF